MKTDQRKPRRRRFYAVERISPGLQRVHTFRTPTERDRWVRVNFRESALSGSERTYRVAYADELIVRDAYGMSKRFGVGFAYTEH